MVPLGLEVCRKDTPCELVFFLQVWFGEHMFSDDFCFYTGYKIPKCRGLEQFFEAIQALPSVDTPQVFGLHPNADITWVSWSVLLVSLETRSVCSFFEFYCKTCRCRSINFSATLKIPRLGQTKIEFHLRLEKSKWARVLRLRVHLIVGSLINWKMSFWQKVRKAPLACDIWQWACSFAKRSNVPKRVARNLSRMEENSSKNYTI